MPMPVTPVASDSPVGQQKKGTASNVATVPFARSSKLHIEQGNTTSGIVINSASPGTFNFPIPSYGYLSAIYLTVAATGGTGVAATYYEDAPWSAIQNIVLTDVNGVPIWQLSGYHSYLASKFGGYRLFGPDVSTLPAVYTAGTTAGNFNFILPIFQEFGQGAMGCLPNMDASARYNLQIVVASGIAGATGPLYTAAPTGYPTLALTVEAQFRSQPPATDMFGNQNSVAPPAVGTVQYWTAQTFPSLTGAQTLQLSRVGNIIRNHVLVFRATSDGTRNTAETSGLPPLIEFDWDVGIRYVNNYNTQRQVTFEGIGYDGPKGVLLFPDTYDPDWIAVAEFGDQWMATVGATKLTLRFTPAASVGLTVLTNDLVPASAQVYAAPVMNLG